MAKKVVAIVGSYRKGGTVDYRGGCRAGRRTRARGRDEARFISSTSALNTAAIAAPAPRRKARRAASVRFDDDMTAILDEIDSADALVLGSPVNFYNVTAVFRTFLERLVGCVYWPWGQWCPKPRSEKLPRKAVLISSSAAPGIFLPFATGVPKALRVAANCLGARPVAKLWIGLAAQSAKPKLVRERAAAGA